jgi:hypothetical protein
MLSSCVTKTQHSSFQKYPDVPFFCNYRVNSVDVIVDHVQESNIASQILTISEAFLESKQKYSVENETYFFLDIMVEQRSFMQNVELYNSIYISCIIRDREGNIYGKENEYISGKQTIIAAAEQNVIMKRILSRLISFQVKRYKDIQKYNKNQ